MQLDNIIVTTPKDDIFGFDKDWRQQIVRAVHAGIHCPDVRIRNDPWISGMLKYMSAPDKLWAKKEYKPYYYALKWFSGGAIDKERTRIDALLLTNVPFSVIAKDMGGTEDDADIFKIYERLCFNIRDDDETLTESCYRRLKYALPAGQVTITDFTPMESIWRFIATQMGYTGLTCAWGWSNAHGDLEDEQYIIKELMRLVQQVYISRIVSRQMNNFDLNAFFGNTIAYAKMRYETRSIDSVESKAEVALKGLFKAFTPKMLDAAVTVDEEKDMVKKLASKIQAEKNIAGYLVNDAGPTEAVDAVMKTMDLAFKQKAK